MIFPLIPIDSINCKKSHYHFENPELMKYCLKVLFSDIPCRLPLHYRLNLRLLMEVFNILVGVNHQQLFHCNKIVQKHNFLLPVHRHPSYYLLMKLKDLSRKL